MNTKPKDGGAAFPRAALISPEGVYVSEGERGMSLRDWFAGLAMAALLSSPKRFSIEDKVGPFEISDVVQGAYIVADALLEERAK